MSIIDGWTLPWPEIRIPSYRTGRVGAWELKRQVQQVLRGYFRGLQTCAENYLLIRENRVWMSLSPIETESLAPHVARMRGHVVIAGLGMGLALYNALLRPAVRRVSVLECDSEVIALFARITGSDWPKSGRFTIEQIDAREWRSPVPVDYLYADIWDKIGALERGCRYAHHVPQYAAQISGLLGHGSRLRFVPREKPLQTASDAIAVSRLGPLARLAYRRLQQSHLARAYSRRRDPAGLWRFARLENGGRRLKRTFSDGGAVVDARGAPGGPPPGRCAGYVSLLRVV